MASTQHPGAAAAERATAADGFARFALKADGVVTGLNGIGYLALAPLLGSFFGIGTSVQYPVGVFLVAYAAGVLVVGTRPRINRNALGFVLAANVVWALLSVVVLVSGALSPTGAGAVWIVLQAVVVGVFAELQYMGLKRM